MGDAQDGVDLFQAGTLARLKNIEDWMSGTTQSVSWHLRDVEDRLKKLADRVTALESRVQTVDSDMTAVRSRTRELRGEIEFIRAEAAPGLFTDEDQVACHQAAPGLPASSQPPPPGPQWEAAPP